MNSGIETSAVRIVEHEPSSFKNYQLAALLSKQLSFMNGDIGHSMDLEPLSFVKRPKR